MDIADKLVTFGLTVLGAAIGSTVTFFAARRLEEHRHQLSIRQELVKRRAEAVVKVIGAVVELQHWYGNKALAWSRVKIDEFSSPKIQGEKEHDERREAVGVLLEQNRYLLGDELYGVARGYLIQMSVLHMTMMGAQHDESRRTDVEEVLGMLKEAREKLDAYLPELPKLKTSKDTKSLKRPPLSETQPKRAIEKR